MAPGWGPDPAVATDVASSRRGGPALAAWALTFAEPTGQRINCTRGSAWCAAAGGVAN
jgi:hypothetical protein